MAGPEHLRKHIDKAAVLVEALPYLQKFRGEIFLIKVGGSAMEDPALVESLLRDVVFLEAVGVNPVLVHGGGKAISHAMAASGLEPRFVHGLRVTDEAAIHIVEEALGVVINPSLVDGILKFGGAAVGISGKEVFVGQKVKAKSEDGAQEVDLGFVGRVIDCQLGEIEASIRGEIVPVVSPLAAEKGSGHVLNVNADIAAAALAGRLQAEKLIYMSDVLGVMQDPEDADSLVHTAGREEVEAMIDEGVISGGMIPKVRSALEALSDGVSKVHLIDGRISHSLLLEIFTDVGVGTQILGESVAGSP